MRASLFTLDLPGPGRVSTMARPRGHDWLADVLVCALTAAELDELGLTEEPRIAATAGLEFVPVPMPDRTVPDPADVLPVLHRLAARLRGGAHVVTHCRAGIGRSSLLAVSLLVLNGTAPDTVWTAVEHARGLAVPDTPAQRAWPAGLPGQVLR
ncbi:tyrosine protein phosphatase [Kitasatospora sp. NPDC085879]|uniref:protein-tyrosine phosphatase family protein n=1 Tax=Kitasatospora sp. NPDC085879 TaxID=3154769 RepID=UPI003413816C